MARAGRCRSRKATSSRRRRCPDTLGAEILRLWVAATDYSGELSISDEILKRVVESYRRIRNTLRFLLANTVGLRSRDATLCPSDELVEIDRYALAMTPPWPSRRMRPNYAALRIPPGRAARCRRICSEDLGGVLSRRPEGPPLHDGQPIRRARRSAQTALARRSATSCCKLMAPILSFTAEEAWRIVHPGEPTIFAPTWATRCRTCAATSRDSAKRWTAILARPRTQC